MRDWIQDLARQRQGMRVDPRQLPTTLREPAMDAGQPVDRSRARVAAYDRLLALRNRADLSHAEREAVETVLNLVDRVEREHLADGGN